MTIAKLLFIYIYIFFSELIIQEKSMGKYHMMNVTYHMSGYHKVTSHDRYEKIVHRPCSSYISSI